MNGFALGLGLKRRLRATRKWDLKENVDPPFPRSQPTIDDRGTGELGPIPFSAYRHDVFITVEQRQWLY